MKDGLAYSGATVQGRLVPRRDGWALDRGQFGVHAIEGFFDPFANKVIRIEIKVMDEPLALGSGGSPE